MMIGIILLRRLALGIKRVSSAWIVVILALYLLLVLVPSYWGGLYRLSIDQIRQGHFDVPLYAGSGSVREAVFPRLPAFVSIAAWYLVPFLSLLLLIALVIIRHTLTRREQIFWIASVLIICVSLYLTYPAAHALLTWLVD